MKNIILQVKRPCPTKEQMVQYLEANNWIFKETIIRRHDGAAIWDEYTKNGNEVRLIASSDFSDYPIHCSLLIGELADLQHCDSFDVYNDIVKVSV